MQQPPATDAAGANARWLDIAAPAPDDDRTRAVRDELERGADPATPQGRRALLAAEFPMLPFGEGEAAPAGGEPVEVDGYRVTPRMHAMQLQLVAGQLWSGEPAEVTAAASELVAIGLDRREVLHELARSIGGTLVALVRGDEAASATWVEGLSQLPARVVTRDERGVLLRRTVAAGDTLRVHRIMQLLEQSDDTGTLLPVYAARLGSMYQAEAMHDEAVTWYRRALEARERTGERTYARAQLASALLLARRDAEAQPELDQLLPAHAADPYVAEILAEAYARRGDHEHAIELLDPAIDELLGAGGTTPGSPDTGEAFDTSRLTVPAAMAIASLLETRRALLQAAGREADERTAALERIMEAGGQRLLDEFAAPMHDDLPLPPPQEPRTVAPTPGRNDPCPCGSGRKFKRCCRS